MEQLQEQLEELGVFEVKKNFDTPAEHAWITDNYGNRCWYRGEPFINNCGENVPLRIL